MKRSSSLPKIPNLGIRSSIAKGKPLLQSFWQYVSSTVIQNSSEALSSASDIKSTECSTSSSNSSSTDDFTDEDDNATLSLKRKEEQDGIDNHQHHKKLKANEQEIQTTTSSLSSLSGTHPDVFTSNQTEEILVTPNDDGHEFISCIQGKDGQMYPRTDYVLSENMIDAYASEWIVALKSHFRYWANR
jgi:hypothetical protein